MLSKAPNKRWTYGEFLNKYSRVIILFLMAMALAIISPTFYIGDNLLNILRQASPLFILGIAQTIVLITGNIDLSMGSCAALSGVIMSKMIRADYNVILAIITALMVGALFGFINGFVTTRIGLPSFVTTFGTYLLGKGLVVLYMGGQVINGFPDIIRFLGKGRLAEIPFIIIIGIIVLVLFTFILYYTNFGTKLYHVGSNPIASVISGIKVKRVVTLSFIICSVMATLACIVYIGRTNTCTSDIGEDFQLDAIATALIGGTSFAGGIGSSGGTAVGALIIVLIKNAMSLIGIHSLWQGFVTGVIMVALMLIDELIKRFANK